MKDWLPRYDSNPLLNLTSTTCRTTDGDFRNPQRSKGKRLTDYEWIATVVGEMLVRVGGIIVKEMALLFK
jgi:hypothetical protein